MISPAARASPASSIALAIIRERKRRILPAPYMVWDSYEKRIVPMGPPSALFVRTEVLTLSGLKFHHLIIPIAAVAAIGLAVIKASRSLGILEILEPDLVLAIGSVLIVFGVFCIASYGLVRAIEWADQRISREERTQASSKGKSERLR
jgi:hypothetical protein